jgi:hypothetical protein
VKQTQLPTAVIDLDSCAVNLGENGVPTSSNIEMENENQRRKQLLCSISPNDSSGMEDETPLDAVPRKNVLDGRKKKKREN